MIKLLGCTMVLLGCLSIGVLEGNRKRHVLHVTQDLIHGLEIMERELAFNKCSLPDMLRKASVGRQDERVRTVFEQCAREIEKGNDFTEKWRDGLSQLNVGRQELELLDSLCMILGQYDGYGQELSVARVRKELQKRLEVSGQEVRSKCRLYIALGGAAGGLLSIVLV